MGGGGLWCSVVACAEKSCSVESCSCCLRVSERLVAAAMFGPPERREITTLDSEAIPGSMRVSIAVSAITTRSAPPKRGGGWDEESRNEYGEVGQAEGE